MASAEAEAMMASRALELGPIGRHVAERIGQMRRDRGWEQRQVAERVTAAGRPMSASAISKVESGARRVDVDDLVAIAAALEVSPALLLLAAPAEHLPEQPAAAEPTSVEAAIREDIEQLGDLEDLEPTLAQMAYRLAREIDSGGEDSGKTLPALSRELREVIRQLTEGRDDPDDEDDGLDDLADPS